MRHSRGIEGVDVTLWWSSGKTSPIQLVTQVTTRRHGQFSLGVRFGTSAGYLQARFLGADAPGGGTWGRAKTQPHYVDVVVPSVSPAGGPPGGQPPPPGGFGGPPPPGGQPPPSGGSAGPPPPPGGPSVALSSNSGHHPSAITGVADVKGRAADASVGTMYGPDVYCNGINGGLYDPGFITIGATATPGSAYPTQWVANRVWLYSYSAGKFVLTSNWEYAQVSQPNPDLVSIGPNRAGNAFFYQGNLGELGDIAVAAEYWYWTGTWLGPYYVYPTSYTERLNAYQATSNNYCDLF